MIEVREEEREREEQSMRHVMSSEPLERERVAGLPLSIVQRVSCIACRLYSSELIVLRVPVYLSPSPPAVLQVFKNKISPLNVFNSWYVHVDCSTNYDT